MRPQEGSPFLPGWRTAQDGLTRIRQKFAAAPMIVKIITVLVIVAVATAAGLHVSRILQITTGLLLIAGLAYGPFAVASGRRSAAASLSVAVLGVALAAAWFGARGQQSVLLTLLLLPLVAAVAAHAGSLGRWMVPCRTIAWVLLWAAPVVVIAGLLAPGQRAIGPALAWAMACIVLGWRLAKSLQEGREFGRQQARGGALAAPHTPAIARRPRDARPGNRDARPGNRDGRTGNAAGPDSRIAQATDLV